MSARRATPAGRLVWIENALWADLAEVMQTRDHPYARQVHETLIAARDAAPADPVGAIHRAMPDLFGTGSRGYETKRMAAERVAVALGFPGGSPRQENPT